jgi:hypothetical protein
MPVLRTSYDTARSDVDYDANRFGPLWSGGVAVAAAACWVSDMVGFRTLPQAGLNVVEAVHGIGGASHGPQDGLRGTDGKESTGHEVGHPEPNLQARRTRLALWRRLQCPLRRH